MRAEIKTLTNRAPRYAAVAIVLGVSVAFFFRDAWLGGFARGYGDSYDGLIEISILQHWYNVFAHGATWNLTDYFHPYADTLGYNDTYLVPGVFFAAARGLGADPFVAVFVSHVAMRGIGFLGMYALLRRGLAVRWPLGLAGAAIFTTANVSLLQMYHGQLLSVGLVPWLALLAIAGIRALRRDDGAGVRRNGIGFAILFGITAFNAFYGAWFFGFFLVLLAIVGAILTPRPERAALALAARRHLGSLALVAFAGVVALLPFLAVYAPKLAEGAHHSWANGAYLYLPDLATLFNVGATNLVWSRPLAALIPAGKTLPLGEDQVGFPVGMLVLLLLAVAWARKDRVGGGLVLPLAITLGVMIVLMMRWPGDVSLWWLVYRIVPGADAARVVSRSLIFALVPVIMIVTVYLDRSARPGWATALIVGFLLLEQVQTKAPLTLDLAPQRAMLAEVGRPPPGCAAFFVVSARSSPAAVLDEARQITGSWHRKDDRFAVALMNHYRHNVDAMLIASDVHVPTINGFSSFNPPDWNFSDPDAPDYPDRVRRYAAAHRLQHVCGLDVRRRPAWFPLSAPGGPPKS